MEEKSIFEIKLPAKEKNQIIGAIRQAFKYSKLYQEAKRAGRVEKQEGFYKNGRQKTRVYYQCDECKSLEKSVDIDHIQRVGGFNGSFDDFISALWCLYSGGLENLQRLCKKCHGEKTARERKSTPRRRRK